DPNNIPSKIKINNIGTPNLYNTLLEVIQINSTNPLIIINSVIVYINNKTELKYKIKKLKAMTETTILIVLSTENQCC
ncbi:hypothetical protein ACTPEF_25920, partial [Clostridioides difficile]